MTLYVVATPLGHLDDLSPRARHVLSTVDVVYAEDTRHSRRLMDAIGARTPMRAYHDHSDDAARDRLLDDAQRGDVALISDAGTPCISDPGYRVVRDAHARGLEVAVVPGPSAVIALLSIAGLPTDRFTFVGFAPRKAMARLEALREDMARRETLVLYESPHRLLDLLDAIATVDGDRPVAVGRELTKLHEEVLTGTAGSIADTFRERDGVKGEIVLAIGGAPEPPPASDAAIDGWVQALAGSSLRTKEAARILADQLGLAKDDAYARVLAARDA